MAAGETPSPELVAAAGETRGLRPAMAWGALGAIVAGVALVAWVGDRVSPLYLDLDQPPQVLAYEARQIIDELGPPAEATDSAFGFGPDVPTAALRTAFWYRQSPRSLAEGRVLEAPFLSFTNPRPLVPGMTGVRLDVHGALVEYLRVPFADEGPPPEPLDWAAVFRWARLDQAAASGLS